MTAGADILERPDPVGDGRLVMTARDRALLLTIARALRTNLLAPPRPYGPEHLPRRRMPLALRRT